MDLNKKWYWQINSFAVETNYFYFLFGVVHHNPPYADLSISFNDLQINPIEEKIIYNAKTRQWPWGELDEKEKNAHLTYDMKLFIYCQYQYQGKEISYIYQTFGVSTSTVKRIVRQFSTNIKREKIYHEIRWKKLISSQLSLIEYLSL